MANDWFWWYLVGGDRGDAKIPRLVSAIRYDLTITSP